MRIESINASAYPCTTFKANWFKRAWQSYVAKQEEKASEKLAKHYFGEDYEQGIKMSVENGTINNKIQRMFYENTINPKENEDIIKRLADISSNALKAAYGVH